MIEEGFSTSTIFDTKNQDFLNEKKYYYINKLEVYYTNEYILGFFPFFNDRPADKKLYKILTIINLFLI